MWAGIPLLFQPGAEWNYSVATDVLGRVIEVVSGQCLDEFLAARILRPLGMNDTGFYAGDTQAPRLAALYTPGRGGTAVRLDALGAAAHRPPAMLGGGGSPGRHRHGTGTDSGLNACDTARSGTAQHVIRLYIADE